MLSSIVSINDSKTNALFKCVFSLTEKKKQTHEKKNVYTSWLKSSISDVCVYKTYISSIPQVKWLCGWFVAHAITTLFKNTVSLLNPSTLQLTGFNICNNNAFEALTWIEPNWYHFKSPGTDTDHHKKNRIGVKKVKL